MQLQSEGIFYLNNKKNKDKLSTGAKLLANKQIKGTDKTQNDDNKQNKNHIKTGNRDREIER